MESWPYSVAPFCQYCGFKLERRKKDIQKKEWIMGKYQYFSDAEVQGLDDDLCQMLSIARGKANVPFIITCGLRTPSQNAALAESVSDSAHLTGHAIDLACTDDPSRFAIIQGLLDAGFTRIGIYSAHIHADNDKTKSPKVCWYVAGT